MSRQTRRKRKHEKQARELKIKVALEAYRDKHGKPFNAFEAYAEAIEKYFQMEYRP